MLAKDDDGHPVPPDFHARFEEIAEAFAARDYLLQHHAIPGISLRDPSTADSIVGRPHLLKK